MFRTLRFPKMPPKGAKGSKSSQKASKIPISSAGPLGKAKKPGKSTAQSTPGSSPALTPQPSVPVTPEASDNEEDRLPVIQSPVKPRKRQATKEIQKMSDFEVWDYNDGDIIAGTFTHLKSAAYAHFDITVEHTFDEEGDPKEIIYLFICKVDPEGHPVQRRARAKTSLDTSNLVNSIQACDKRLGIVRESSGLIKSTSSESTSFPYSRALHCVVAVLRCSDSQRPFNMQGDFWYLVEVEMLRAGAVPPSPQMVSHDMRRLYPLMSGGVRKYFQDLDQALHIVLDGWTAPIIASYLGLVVVWYDKGEIHRTILEFIRLKQSHTGEYLAEEVAACLKRFGLQHLLFLVTIDNAANCDKLAVHLPTYIPTFRGPKMRVRCIAYILNLIAKAFMSFFFKKSAKKTNAILKDGALVVEERETELDDVVAEEMDEDDDVLVDDDGHGAFNHATAHSLHDQAILLMQNEGVTVARLARRINDSPKLREQFEDLVISHPDHGGQKRALPQCVPTRWNSDQACLRAHIDFRDKVEMITCSTADKLGHYRLTDEQWELAEDLAKALELFEEPTRQFSQKGVPLIVDVLPMLLELKLSMQAIRDSDTDDDPAHDITCIAAQAAILFKSALGFTTQHVKKIKDMVVERWKASYASGDDESQLVDSEPVEGKKNRFKVTLKAAKTNYPVDHILTYLDEPAIPSTDIQAAGGYMKWWYTSSSARKSVAKMAMDYCSAPVGRRQINFMQQNMSSFTFHAKMAMGSWSNTPLFPGVKAVAEMIGESESDEEDGS
ncbi:hypothetical protein D9756_011467 [Leucocoprinus leucothites]|uniref:Uncharacterized protein n=1 Tax=Leucocoprinus leucothites TaxID=201217 RepID=A0A8H5CR43_9AGAR|nr:hypothetical protein D9756_011467 [Leucoagaricus leucothites]